jgi:glycine/D-amino acid oxidase-like deaminating enzyme
LVPNTELGIPFTTSWLLTAFGNPGISFANATAIAVAEVLALNVPPFERIGSSLSSVY